MSNNEVESAFITGKVLMCTVGIKVKVITNTCTYHGLVLLSMVLIF